MKNLDKWKHIQHLNDDLGLEAASFEHNTTDLQSDSELLKLIGIALLKAVKVNKDDLVIQDLLNELDMNGE